MGEVLQDSGDVAGNQLARRLGVAPSERVDDGTDACLAVEKLQDLDSLLVRQSKRLGAGMIQRCRASSKRTTIWGARLSTLSAETIKRSVATGSARDFA